MSESPVVLAYIDPGTGSYVLQLALAGLLGAGYTLRKLWVRMARFFRRDAESVDDDAQR